MGLGTFKYIGIWSHKPKKSFIKGWVTETGTFLRVVLTKNAKRFEGSDTPGSKGLVSLRISYPMLLLVYLSLYNKTSFK